MAHSRNQKKYSTALIVVLVLAALVSLFFAVESVSKSDENAQKKECVAAQADDQFIAWADLQWIGNTGDGSYGCQAAIRFRYDPEAPGFTPLSDFEFRRASQLFQSCKLEGVIVGEFGGLVSLDGNLGHRPVIIGDFQIFPRVAEALALTGLDGEKLEQCPT